MKKRKIQHKNIILALTLTSLVFIMGILIGDMFVSEKYDVLSSTISDLQIKTISMELEFDLLLENPCSSNSSYLLDELNTLSERLGYLEQIYGEDSPRILTLKKYYSLLLVRHWVYIKKLNEECNLDANRVIYFYSNDDCDDCKMQGNILTAFRKSSSDTNYIYPLDINIDDPSLNALKRIYSLNATPSLIFNEEVLTGLIELNELEEISLR